MNHGKTAWSSVACVWEKMGSVVSQLNPFGRKRKREDDDDEWDDDAPDLNNVNTPKRRKLMSTTQYIHKTLFEGGQESDVTILALNREWNLHKIYLNQSPYFSSMFNGPWLEANAKEIEIEIADPTITVEALNFVLGSLYQDEVCIDPVQVASIVGCATLFQLDSMLAQCIEVMKETINVNTFPPYYETAQRYSVKPVLEAITAWLEHNLLGVVQENPKQLRRVSIDMMRKIVSSPKLYVIQTEFSLYILLKLFVFLSENPEWDGTADSCTSDTQKFFKDRGGEAVYFLSSPDGSKYVPPFKALRLQNLITHHMDVEMLLADRLIPFDWLSPVFRTQWYQMLRFEQGIDNGAKDLSEEVFSKSCVRCGRVLTTEGPHVWRWTGFVFGLDIIVTFDRKGIKLKRNYKPDENPSLLLSQKLERRVMFRIRLACLNDQKQVVFAMRSGLRSVGFLKNQEYRVLNLDKRITYPLLIGAEFAFATPLPDTFNIEPALVAVQPDSDKMDDNPSPMDGTDNDDVCDLAGVVPS